VAALTSLNRPRTRPATARAAPAEGVDMGPLLELVAAVLRVEAKLDRLLAQRRPASTLSREDYTRLARLLPAVGGQLGSEPFIASEVIEHDSPAVRVAARGLSARQLGRLLRRATGQPVAGLVIERLGSEAGAAIWRLLRAEFPQDRNPAVPRAAGADR
jgi:hypothetical protein